MTRPWRWIAALALLGACGDDGDKRDLAHEAQQVRELTLKTAVPVVHMTREEYRAASEEDLKDVDEAELREYAETYGRLGFFPVTLDLRPTIAGSRSDFAAASYSPTDKDITLVDEPDDDVVIHEYVHALQDQNYGIDMEYPTSDAFLARRAIVEGDAVMAQLRWLAWERELDLGGLAWTRAFDSFRSYSDSTLRDPGYPLFFVAYPTFAYAYGLEYNVDNLLGATYQSPAPKLSVDYTRQDALFGEAGPRTTHDVLRRFVGEAPLTPGLDAVPADLDATFEKVDWDSLGEWYVFLLLAPLDGPPNAFVQTRTVAATWRGDRALFVKDRRSGAYGVVWASEWTDEAKAHWVMGQLAKLHAQPSILKQKGTRVVIVIDVAAPEAERFSDAAFATPSPGAKPAGPRHRPSLAQLIGPGH